MKKWLIVLLICSLCFADVFTSNIRPNADNTLDVGATSYGWKDLYLAGNITDNTNTLSVSDLQDSYDHITSTGDSHTYIDQSVVSGSAPVFVNTNMTGNISVWTNDSLYIDLTDLSATSPLAYDNTTGVFSLSSYDIFDVNGVCFVDVNGIATDVNYFSWDDTSHILTVVGTGIFNTLTGTNLNLTANSNQIVLDSNGTYTTTLTDSAAVSSKIITFPNITGTLALTSDLSSYLPLAGGTMSGAIAMGGYAITGGGAITGTSFTDGTTTITGGDYTGVDDITGTDVDISAGTGDYTSTTGTIGLNATPSSAIGITIGGTTVSYTSSFTGLNPIIMAAPSSADQSYAGQNFTLRAKASSQNITAFNGVLGNIGTATGSLYTGTITKSAAFSAIVSFAGNTGGSTDPTITELIGFDLASMTTSLGTVVGTAYGLKLPSVEIVGATNYAIYSAGGQSVHAGNLRIGSVVAPTVALDVTGAGLISTTLGITGLTTATGGVSVNSDTSTVLLGADGDISLYSNAAGTLIHTAGTADTNLTFNFTGTTNTGQYKWMEDEDYFQFNDDILINADEKLCFRATGSYIYSPSSTYLTMYSSILDIGASSQLYIRADTGILYASDFFDFQSDLVQFYTYDVSPTLIFSIGENTGMEFNHDIVLLTSGIDILVEANKGNDIGTASHAIDDVYADDFQNVASPDSYYIFDKPLEIVKKITHKVGKSDEIDISSIPEWIRTVDVKEKYGKNKEVKITGQKVNDNCYSIDRLQLLQNQAIQELARKVETLENENKELIERIEKLEK